MVWQSFENQGVGILDEPMAEQLSQYLEKKEAQVGARLLKVLEGVHGSLPLLEGSLFPSATRLNLAIEEFGRKLQRLSENPEAIITNSDWNNVVEQVNQTFWSYLEVLEGCVIELFQQIDQTGFELWNVDLSTTVTSVKDELTHRLDDLSWGMKRVEQQLQDYCQAKQENKANHWRRWLGWTRLLDKDLESHTYKCLKFLNFRYQRFVESYKGYLQLYQNAEIALNQLYGYRAFSSLDLDIQDKFKKLYMLQKIWELNLSARVLPLSEPVRALRNFARPESVEELFSEYLSSIRKAIFDKSRMIKKEFRLVFIDKQARQPIIDNLKNHSKELSLLKTMINNYREFLAKNDSKNKQEVVKIFNSNPDRMEKHLKGLREETEKLDNLCKQFQISLESENALEQKLTGEVEKEVAHYLHEIGQPLASKSLIQRNCKALLNILQNLDEISAFYPEVVDYICRTLGTAMCWDWKYHILQQIPLFHQVYEVHQNIAATDEYRPHLNRYNKFRRILELLAQRIKDKEIPRYFHEIELDMNDLKAYLQDFLASIQRLGQNPEALKSEQGQQEVSMANQALLEYLYLFGKFFHSLSLDDPEHKLIRKQLLFVDQYFETIELELNEFLAKNQ